MSKKEIEVLYICDRLKCDNCSKECFYTTDIRHAASFYKTEPNLYAQNIIQPSQPIKEILENWIVEIKEESED